MRAQQGMQQLLRQQKRPMRPKQACTHDLANVDVQLPLQRMAQMQEQALTHAGGQHSSSSLLQKQQQVPASMLGEHQHSSSSSSDSKSSCRGLNTMKQLQGLSMGGPALPGAAQGINSSSTQLTRHSNSSRTTRSSRTTSSSSSKLTCSSRQMQMSLQ